MTPAGIEPATYKFVAQHLKYCATAEWPRGFQDVQVPRFHENGTGYKLGSQPYTPATFTPTKYSWYPFLLDAGSTPAP